MNSEPANPGKSSDVFLSERELHERWGRRVALYTLKRWRSRKVGPAFVRLAPRKVAYRLADVEAYEQRQRVDTAPAA